MENVMPDFTPEQLTKVAQEKANEILNMFKTTIASSSELDEETVTKIAVAVSLTHIKPFKDPLTQIKPEMLNGAAMERLKLVADFWSGVETYLQSL
jgi:UDP-galactopyranose mutase